MREAYFHEDDYGQIEVLSISNWDYCLSQLKKIGKFSDEHFDGIGWTDMYIRDENPQRLASLNINVKDLASVLGETLEPYDKVLTGYSSYREESKRTLAFGSENSCIVFVGYDSNDIIQDIWLDFGIVTQNDKELALKGLSILESIGEMIIVDWGVGSMIKLSDKDKIMSYFNLREESRAHALRTLRQHIDNLEKNESSKNASQHSMQLIGLWERISRWFRAIANR